jgi:hypothetical protein
VHVVAVGGHSRSCSRSIQRTKAQCDAAASRVSEAAKLGFSFQRGAQKVRQVCEWRGLIGWDWRVDECGRRYHDEFGFGGQPAVNEEPGRVGTQQGS